MTKTTLVLGGTGKTGRRIVQRLTTRGLPVRAGSRSGEPPFDWDDQSTWAPALRDVMAAYLVYYPDLVMPGAAPAIGAFAGRAVDSGVRRLVLLCGRGEDATHTSEQAVRECGAGWTILRASWFAQNLSEGFLLEPVLSGEIALPAGDVPEPFTGAGDIADVAVAALTAADGHAGQIYELTGPRLLSFGDTAGEISKAASRELRHVPISPQQYASALAGHIPAGHAAMLAEMFTRVLDGRNTHLTDGVERAPGRRPRHFSEGLGIGTVFEQGGGDRTAGQGSHDEHDVAGDRGPGVQACGSCRYRSPGSLANQRHAVGANTRPVSGRSVQPVKGRPACI